ncbi:MAG: type II toxin-antitoxin system PemK/MazF family toxin [Actinobacteria bacterium]|nr:type II toxin-antitoxin system PemK/MazF family toxin [Actinomycetota bacterium]
MKGYPKRREIWLVSLESAKEHEIGKTRPVVVISPEDMNIFLPIVAVVPLTSMKAQRKIYPTEVLLLKSETGLKKDSVLMSHQVRVISKTRLVKQCGVIDSGFNRDKIRGVLKIFLDL